MCVNLLKKGLGGCRNSRQSLNLTTTFYHKDWLFTNIIMCTLLTVLHTFLMVLAGRICLNIRTLSLVIISFLLITCKFHRAVVILEGDIRCLSLLGLKGLICQISSTHCCKQFLSHPLSLIVFNLGNVLNECNKKVTRSDENEISLSKEVITKDDMS